MKIKNEEIVKIFNKFPELMEKRLPVKLGFAISKNMKKLEGIAQVYDQQRRNILNKYCERDDDGALKIEGNEYVLKQKKEYAEEMNELLGIENEVELHTITMEEVEKCDLEKFDSLSPAEIGLLGFMIEE